MADAEFADDQQDEITAQQLPMWGIETQRTIVRERMKLLLAAHDSNIVTESVHAPEGTLLMHQGDLAERVLLLSKGTVAIQVRQTGEEPSTLAVVEAEELLGELGLFGHGRHTADVRVIQGPADVIAIPGDQLLQAMLFDSDLAIELLRLSSQRCLQGNSLVGLLLDGIKAADQDNAGLLEQTCTALRQHGHSIAMAADQLQRLRN